MTRSVAEAVLDDEDKRRRLSEKRRRKARKAVRRVAAEAKLLTVPPPVPDSVLRRVRELWAAEIIAAHPRAPVGAAAARDAAEDALFLDGAIRNVYDPFKEK
jgi:hypothetical protein